MNTVAKGARSIDRTRTRRGGARVARPGLGRRITAWWANDTVTTQFAAERAREERLVRPGRC